MNKRKAFLLINAIDAYYDLNSIVISAIISFTVDVRMGKIYTEAQNQIKCKNNQVIQYHYIFVKRSNILIIFFQVNNEKRKKQVARQNRYKHKVLPTPSIPFSDISNSSPYVESSSTNVCSGSDSSHKNDYAPFSSLNQVNDGESSSPNGNSGNRSAGSKKNKPPVTSAKRSSRSGSSGKCNCTSFSSPNGKGGSSSSASNDDNGNTLPSKSYVSYSSSSNESKCNVPQRQSSGSSPSLPSSSNNSGSSPPPSLPPIPIERTSLPCKETPVEDNDNTPTTQPCTMPHIGCMHTSILTKYLLKFLLFILKVTFPLV